MSEKSNFLIGLVGLPASGKSSFAKRFKDLLKEKVRDFEILIIDPDIIRESLTGNEFDPAKEKLVREKNLEDIHNALKQDKIVISDDLNYYTSMRHDLKSIANYLKLHFFIIYISTPLETCLKWNDKRGNKIPNQLIRDIHKRFDDFKRYNWDKPLEIFNLSKEKNIDERIEKTIESIIYSIQEPINGLKDEKLEDTSIKFNEKIEFISRRMVGDLLKETGNRSLKEILLKERKEFVKLYLNKPLEDNEIFQKFTDHLLKNEKIKNSLKF